MLEKITIGIINDNPNDLQNLYLGFRKFEFIKIGFLCSNLTELLVNLKNEKIDLLLTDLNMTPINGIQIISIINKCKLIKKTIIISNLISQNNAKEIKLSMANGYTNKKVENIIQAIIKVNQGEQFYEDNLTNQNFNRILSETKMRIDKINPLQLKIIRLLAKGYTAKEIGDVLFVSKRTVQTYIFNLIHEFEFKNCTHLVAWAASKNIIKESEILINGALINKK